MSSLRAKYNKRIAAVVAVLAVAAGAGIYFMQGSPAPLRERVAALVQRPKPTVLGWPVAVSVVAGDGSAGFADGVGRGARFADPFGLVLDRAGNLFVSDAGENNRIRRIGADGVVSTFAGGREGFADGSGAAAAFHTPSGMAIDRAGNLYVADTGNNAIRKITPQGLVSTLAGGGEAGYADGKGAEARFNGPLGVALDKAGRVFVADTYNDRIRMIGLDGMVTTVAGGEPGYVEGPAGLARFDTPTSVVVDPKGVLFVADSKNGAVRKVEADGTVSTLASNGRDAMPHSLRRPLSLALTHDGFLYVGDMARGRIFQVTPAGELHGLTGIGIDIEIGDDKAVRFARPSALALDAAGGLYVADAVGRVVRKLSVRGVAGAPAVPLPQPVAPAQPAVAEAALVAKAGFPWPFKPQHERHEVVGTIGEVRGSYDGEHRDHFHSGLDVQADMGVPVLAVADEKVSSPLANWAYGDLGEGMSIDSMAYIHMRVGRTLKDKPLDPARFTIFSDDKGKPMRVRVKRGTRFAVGDALGTVNRMFHVHLVYEPSGRVANPLLLPFSGFSDTQAPRIDKIALYDAQDKALVPRRGKRLQVARAGGPLSIVVDAYDQADGNAARRKLGLHRAGYQVLSADGTPLPGYEKPLVNIEFNQLPPDPESVKVAYADKSGITVYGSATTRFLYVVTNTVRDGVARSGTWDPAGLAPGDYIIRIFAADYVGNEALSGRDLAISVE